MVVGSTTGGLIEEACTAYESMCESPEGMIVMIITMTVTGNRMFGVVVVK